jgi:hypothetical protein
MADTIGIYLYALDDGSLYRVRLKSLVSDNTIFGFTADDATRPWKPARLLMRYCLAYAEGAHRVRKVYSGNTESLIWQIRPYTISLPNADGTLSNYDCRSWHGEQVLKPLLIY